MNLMRWAPDRAAALACLAIVATVAAAYSNSLDCPFIFDDGPSIKENLSLRRWEQVWPAVLDMPGDGSTVQGRPVLNLSFALNYAAAGLDVRAYHLTNVAVHALAALALFGLVRLTLRLPSVPPALSGRATGVALAAALVWAAHPLQTESVTYVVQRAESLAGLWYLLTLYAFAAGAVAARSWPWYAACVACCALGMGTKEVVVSAPLAVLLYDRAFLSGSFASALRSRRRLYVALAATWVLLAALVATSGNRGDSAGFDSPVSAVDYARSQPVFILRYLRLAAWPSPLVLDYGVELVTDPLEYAPAALAVAALAAAALWAAVRRPQVGFLAFLFFALLAPTSSVVPVATQTAAEHRMYLPLAPLVVLAVAGSILGVQRLASGRTAWSVAAPRLALGGWVVAALILAALTFIRNADYRTVEGMWQDVASKRPGNDRAHAGLAEAALNRNDPQAAEREYRTATSLAPTYQNWVRLGVFLRRQNRNEEARHAFNEAVNRDRQGYGYLARAWFFTEVGEYEAALRDAEEAISQSPVADAYRSRALIRAKTGKPALAIDDYTKAIALAPEQPAAYEKRGLLRGEAGDRAGAIADLTEAIRLSPEDAAYFVSRADNFLALGKTQEALADLNAAIRLDPHPLYFYLRGELYRRQERYDSAIADLTRAIDGNPDERDAYIARAFCYARKQRLDLVRQDLLRYQQLGGELDEKLKAFLARGRKDP